MKAEPDGRSGAAALTGTRTHADAEAAFRQYDERLVAYVDKVHADGDQMWWEDPTRRTAVCRRLGLPADTEPEAVRRALWDRSKGTK